MDKSTCAVDNCEADIWNRHSNGKCQEHHMAGLHERFGDVSIPKPGTRERMIRRFWASIEAAEDGCWDWTGDTVKGYGRLSQRGKLVYAHRLSWEIEHGDIPDGLFVDHACHNTYCVNPQHLRLVTNKENIENRTYETGPRNKSGVHGVHWSKSAKKWQALVRNNGKTHHVGYFTDLDEAAEAARLKRNELFTHNDKDRNAA